MTKKRVTYELYLFNDDVTPMNHVIETLHHNVPLCNKYRAEQMAIIAESAGKCRVYSGGEKEVFMMYSVLIKSGLLVDVLIPKK